MQGTKRFTKRTFTKRVDHDGGRHREARSLPEPTRCESCGAVYSHRRWTVPTLAERAQYQLNPDSYIPQTCPACRQQKDGIAGGYVHLEGKFLEIHWREIYRLLRREAYKAFQANPLARVIEWGEDSQGKMVLSTTTEHLAQRLGHALEKAFKGEVRYDFSHENKLAHVWWKRD